MKEGRAVNADHDQCPYKLAHEVRLQALADDIGELKERVKGLEAVLGRGVMLLVANLAAVLATLAGQWF